MSFETGPCPYCGGGSNWIGHIENCSAYHKAKEQRKQKKELMRPERHLTALNNILYKNRSIKMDNSHLLDRKEIKSLMKKLEDSINEFCTFKRE